MKSIILASLVSLLPAIGLALPAVVTGGEHNDFTRLVVTLPEPSEWRLGRVADGYTLSVNQEGLDYDLRKAFTRIPKTRLADVAQIPESSDLHIVAACPCYVTAFAFRPNVIVLDIRGGTPPEESAFEAPLVSFASKREVVPAEEVTQAEAQVALNWTARVTPAPQVETPVDIVESQLPAGFRENITKQLGVAASQGLVTLDTPPPQRNESPDAAIAAPPSDAHFRVMSEAGMDMRLGGAVDELEPIQDVCLPDDAVDISSWGEPGEEPAQVLAMIRSMLVTDADRLPADKVAEAAKRYLFLGFGAEAQLLLSTQSDTSNNHKALVDIGKILDGERIEQSVFRGMEVCNNAAALWAVLARDDLRPSEAVAAGAVVQAFSAMPFRLRELLAPRVIDRFIESGDQNTAHMIRDTISRVSPELPTSMQFAEARLELMENRPDQAKEALEAASVVRSPNEADALVALVEMAFAEREPVTPERIEMLQTLAAQNKGQEIAQDLNNALVIAYALSGEFGLAKKALAEASTATPKFWQLMAEIGSDATILELAFVPPEDLSQLSGESAAVIADKLLKLGFPRQALLWLDLPNIDSRSLPDTSKLIAAESYLALSEPEKAIEVTLTMGDAARAVKAKAMLQLGNQDEALSLLGNSPEHQRDMFDIRLKAREWQAPELRIDEAWGKAAEIVADPTEPTSVATPTSLASAQQSASNSEAARGVIAKLLLETQLSQ